MIKKIVIVGTLLFLSSKTFSQEHRLSAGMGIGTTSQIFDSFQVVGSAFSNVIFNGAQLNEARNLGEFRLAYAYTPKNRWSFGGVVSYSTTDFDVNYQGSKIGEQTSNYYTVAAETTYAYMKKEKMRLYGLLGAGATFSNDKVKDYSDKSEDSSNSSFFNFQVTPIGFSYGKNWGGFIEAGVGYRGLFSFGLFYDL